MGSSFLSLLATALFLFFSAGDSDLAADRAALLRLSSAVRGNTLRWNQSEQNPCSWSGVECDNATARVIGLRLPGDGLSGQIPLSTIGNLTGLRTLSLRSNSLRGPLPSDLALSSDLTALFLQENQFSGEIPAFLFGLNNLSRLDLAGNNFSGEVSTQFNSLTNLRLLHLQNNQFTGSLPALRDLRSFNVSFNRLNGSIPSTFREFDSSAFVGNSLCGQPLSSCPDNGNELSPGAIAGIVIGSVIGALLIATALFILWRNYAGRNTQHRVKPSPVETIVVRQNSRLNNGYSGALGDTPTVRPEAGNATVSVSGGDDGLVFFGGGVKVFGMEELLRASAEVLGKGTFGSTYRAYLEGENEVIVKRLKDVCTYEREFREKIEELGVLVHENLLPIRAYYYGRDEKLLAYDSMRMGSLAALLHGNRGADRAALTWNVRSSIALGAARGIEHLHSIGPKVSHANIKSSNILLTDNYGACVSEFGISQLVSSTSALNMNGYCAPEVNDSRRVSQNADVYSFGVLLLELLTGKVPTHALSSEDGLDLPGWVQSVVQQKLTIDVFDPELLRYQNIEDQMVQLLQLALHCTSQHPDRRPPMGEVSRRIEELLLVMIQEQ